MIKSASHVYILLILVLLFLGLIWPVSYNSKSTRNYQDYKKGIEYAISKGSFVK